MWAMYVACVLWALFVISFFWQGGLKKEMPPRAYVMVLDESRQVERLEDEVGRIVRKAYWIGEPLQVIVIDETGREETRRLIRQLMRRYGQVLKTVKKEEM
ncbi:MAG: hypothetical protein BSOLF_1042 [Candidatus Carbobacillus altaicus]|uniref:Glycosyltransferase n=1 Tax=Candidatus Carbonibacillus altaicus TaxID=2163959 RepID=A0A2R6XZZ4_9BACL|nr:MAG: hypothetical protein BSOLF_1042 [Candidatus Carbobacillus altaicus]